MDRDPPLPKSTQRPEPPELAKTVPLVEAGGAPGWLSLPAMRYPNEYVWFLFFSSLDIMLTWAILQRGGSEVNPLAALVIADWGLPGAIMFKFSLVLAVILVSEIVGRVRDRLGRNLSQLAVVVSAMPVMYSMALLLVHVWRPASE